MDFTNNNKEDEVIKNFDNDKEVVVDLEQELIVDLHDLGNERRKSKKLVKNLYYAND